jgi:hypothetical protein
MALYLVTVPPGAPVAGVGFIQPGHFFLAPSPDYVPSKSFLPCDAEAQAELAKLGVKKAIVKPTAPEGPAVERGVSLSEIAKLEDQRKHDLEHTGIVAPRPAKGRAADK